MGVSVFPGRENLVPNVERVARDACSRLTQATRESINDRLRDVLSRLVEELVLEGGLFFVPFEPQIANIAIGSLPASGRAIAECLAAGRLKSIPGAPEVLSACRTSFHVTCSGCHGAPCASSFPASMTSTTRATRPR